MATNGLRIANEIAMEEEYLRKAAELTPAPIKARAPEAPAAEEFALAPMVDKIAYGIAKGLVEAVKELERHIATETQKVGSAVDRRLDALQTSFQEISKFAAEQRTANAAVEERLQQLAAAGENLRDADARQTAQLEIARAEARETAEAISQRIEKATSSLGDSQAKQAAELESLRAETGASAKSTAQRIEELCRELGIHQEDIGAAKTALGASASRVDALVERMDRQADAFRSMNAAYAQREQELEQVVNGLTRLRAYPTSLPTNGL